MAQSIVDKMKANSKAWHTADAATKKKLEAENQSLGKQTGGSYDSQSGTWSDKSGSSLYGGSNNNNNAATTNKGSSGGSIKVGATGNAQKGLTMGTIVDTAAGQYKIVDKNTPGANYNSASGYYSIKVPASGAIAKQQGAANPATTTYKDASGQDQAGYIINNQTFKDAAGTQRIDSGSVVTAAGKNYLMTDAGKGMDITGASMSSLYGRDEGGNIDTQNVLKKLYNVGGTSYDSSGQVYRDVANEGEVVKAANGKYYNARTGQEVYNNAVAPVVAEDPAVQQMFNMIYDIANQQIALDPTLSWEEAWARANQSLSSQYDQALDTTMQGLDANALRSGFFGQLPTEALKRETAGKLEVDKLNTVNQLAAQLFGQSENSAYKKLDAQTQANQSKINSMLNLLGIQNAERTYGDSRSDTDWEKEVRQAQLTGKYNGQPTLDFLTEKRLSENR